MPTETESAVDILRRIEPLVHRIAAAQQDQGNRLHEQADCLSRIETHTAKIPTAWQLVGIVAVVNAVSVAFVVGLVALR